MTLNEKVTINVRKQATVKKIQLYSEIGKAILKY